MKTVKTRFGVHLWLVLGTACASSPLDEPGSTKAPLVVSSDACAVEYTVTSEWQGGFGANVRVTNHGSTQSGWTLEWDYGSGQQVTSLWNGQSSQGGQHVTVHDAGWNGTLASGQSVSVGLNGTWSGSNGAPSGFRLNGQSCEGGPTGSGGSGSGGSGAGGSGADGGTSGGGSGGSQGGTAGSDSGGTSGGGQGGTTSGCSAPAYQPGASYSAGDQVSNNGSLYQCKPFPYSGWCSMAAYEPGTSAYWSDAWDLLGPCTGGSGGSSNGGSGGSSEGGSSSGGGGSDGGTGGGGTSSGGASSGGSAGSSSGGTAGAGGASSGGCDDPGLVWKTARKTHYTSYPDPGSDECVYYNGCQWAGQFAACNGQKSEDWVAAHNIAAMFPNFGTYELHDVCIRSGNKSMVVTIYDTCADSDCSGCCTQNQGSNDALIDLESYTNARWGLADGIIEWADLGPTEGDGCN